MTLIAASLLGADHARQGEALLEAERAGVDWFHLDAMDGHFAPNIAFGPDAIRDLRKLTRVRFDVHLMLSDPAPYLQRYRDAGADVLTVHAEACTHLDRVLAAVTEMGAAAGLAINPATPLSAAEWVLDRIELLLLMSVNPGYSGQRFLERTCRKVEEAARLRERAGATFKISVDGGVGMENAADLVMAGADVLVCATAIFASGGVQIAVRGLRSAVATARST